eukprot:CAMPEP_0174945500 /NCGR_PEP_ID=MMETSP1355-20121228/81822_1 /TAXON_ID=464990 /ORGANISM="Hemiselmis tepida, Strain CCMP443" /LENGTH=93 /DNA_ID=CAMNT_0016192881 /DNA_START=219 /DNA_END=496 /DNA_ORIENTATION=+
MQARTKMVKNTTPRIARTDPLAKTSVTAVSIAPPPPAVPSQEELPLVAVCPDGHGSHSAEPALAANVSTPHSVHVLAPSAEYLPLGHKPQDGA